MDPIANLNEQRDLVTAILAACDRGIEPGGNLNEEAERLAEYVEALDAWRKGGGFDPYTQPLR